MARKKKNVPGGGSSSLNTPFLAEGSIIARSAPKIGESNRGRQMLEAMGYQDGEALYRERGRATEPILLRFKGTTAGLGAVVGKKNKISKYQRPATQYVTFVASTPTSTSTEARAAVTRHSQTVISPRESAALRQLPMITPAPAKPVTRHSLDPSDAAVQKTSSVITQAIAEAHRRSVERRHKQFRSDSISLPSNVQVTSNNLRVLDHGPQLPPEIATKDVRELGEISRPALRGLANSMFASNDDVLTTPFSRLSVSHNSVTISKSSIPELPMEGVIASTISNTEEMRLDGVMAKNKGLKSSCWA